MYNRSTISKGTIWDVANGIIHFQDISLPGATPKQIMARVTTPWGEVDDTFFDEGECRPYSQTLYDPFRIHVYIVKVVSINPIPGGGTAEFQVLSYAHNDSLLKHPVTGANQLIVTDNLPSRALPGSTVNYQYKVTNNSTTSISLRYIFATNTDIFPMIYATTTADCNKPLPPITYTTKKCWYDDWVAGTPGCQTTTIGVGVTNLPLLDGTITMPSTGEERFTLGVFVEVANYWPGKNEWVTPIGYQFGWLKSIIADACVGLPACPDICIRDPITGIWDKWSQRCNPSTGICELYQKITPDDPTCCAPDWQCEPGRTGYEIDGCGHRRANIVCTASHYIEYDFSFLPSSFLNLVTTNIVDISNTIGRYLPLPSNIQYVGSTYANRKFRIYVNYTPPLSGLSSSQLAITTPVLIPYILSNNNINSQSMQSLQIIQTIEAFATALAAIIVFIIALWFGLRFGWFGVVGAAIIAVIAAVVVSWAIHNLLSGITDQRTGDVPTPKEKIEIVKEYYTTYLEPSCADLYPECAATPPTCDAATMRAYVGCMGGAKLAQCKHAAAQAGDPEDSCDPTLNDLLDTDTCLANGTCTPEDAKNALEDIIDSTDEYIDEKENQVTCDPEYVYDIEQKKCVPEDQCLVREPLTGKCIISPGLAGAAIMIVGIAVGGFIIYKIATR